MPQTPLYSSFWDHLDDLRRTLFRAIIVITCGILVSFCFSEYVLNFLTSPLNTSSMDKEVITQERVVNRTGYTAIYTLKPDERVLEEGPEIVEVSDHSWQIPDGSFLRYEVTKSRKNLVLFGPLEGMLAAFKVSFWVGLVGTSPVWIWFLLQFVAPALTTEESSLIWPFLWLSAFFLGIGGLFAFYVTIPLANQYLQAFNETIAANLWSLSNYIDYTLVLVLGHALGFEFGLVLLILVRLGVLTAEMLSSKRRYFIVFAFVIGALLTPPDIPTQFMLAIPLILMYEMTILYARIREGRANIAILP